MSMSQANAALMLDVYAETARLGITLTQAERMVDQASQKMGQKIDSSFGQVGNKVIKMLGAAVGAGLAVKVMDDALRKLAEGIREGQGAQEIGLAIGNAVAESIKSVPVIGALGELAAMAFDPLMGGAMGDEAARKRTMDHYARMAAGEEALRQIRLRSATEEEALAEWKRQEIEKLNSENKKAQDAAYAYEERLNEKALENAIERAKKEEEERGFFRFGMDTEEQSRQTEAFLAEGRGASPRDVEAIRLGVDPSAFMDKVQTEQSRKRQQEISKAYEDAVKAISAEADKKLADAQAKRDAEAKRRQDEFAREQEKARSEQERMLKEQEAAYDVFIRGNALDAINAIEAQITALTATQGPTREQRLAGLMGDFGVSTANTALGAFTFAQGDPTEISRSILHNAEQQLATLERIEALQEQANRIAEEAGLR